LKKGGGTPGKEKVFGKREKFFIFCAGSSNEICTFEDLIFSDSDPVSHDLKRPSSRAAEQFPCLFSLLSENV